MKRSRISKQAPYRIETDGTTVWVNGKAICLGRFAKFGIDIHNDIEGQMNGVACLECIGFPNLTAGVEQWEQFKAGMLKHHNVVISDKYMPEWIAKP